MTTLPPPWWMPLNLVVFTGIFGTLIYLGTNLGVWSWNVGNGLAAAFCLFRGVRRVRRWEHERPVPVPLSTMVFYPIPAWTVWPHDLELRLSKAAHFDARVKWEMGHE